MSDPNNQYPAFDQSPYGQASYGQASYGQAPQGAYGQAQPGYGQAPQVAYGQAYMLNPAPVRASVFHAAPSAAR